MPFSLKDSLRENKLIILAAFALACIFLGLISLDMLMAFVVISVLIAAVTWVLLPRDTYEVPTNEERDPDYVQLTYEKVQTLPEVLDFHRDQIREIVETAIQSASERSDRLTGELRQSLSDLNAQLAAAMEHSDPSRELQRISAMCEEVLTEIQDTLVPNSEAAAAHDELVGSLVRHFGQFTARPISAPASSRPVEREEPQSESALAAKHEMTRPESAPQATVRHEEHGESRPEERRNDAQRPSEAWHYAPEPRPEGQDPAERRPSTELVRTPIAPGSDDSR